MFVLLPSQYYSCAWKDKGCTPTNARKLELGCLQCSTSLLCSERFVLKEWNEVSATDLV
ncbi:uncharacterized protein PHALS_03745 [Plasmopara halstedii]|uniref:Uncharacterized protein n=1 Tax=Plasmopara halstedii TaxID=4781 RepID=A0A0P1AZH2_PLAHL|nr:uncharacterized protein PHALS_03745 [Plasmopara halstedii]CEG47090.1 hypothetical protein PHALS_03745 [Plasmopara halstedii]|eukprot:XP_024583459.1 hypothetical protein PHALS_03745 [Plasmopara halstedii]